VTALAIIAFIVALSASIMLHEAGHFFAARRFGMKATQFFLGFGPTLWSVRRGETEYGIKAIPAGGFVKIVGMTPLEEVDSADESRAFYRQPTGRRSIVLAAGSVTHLLLAFVLFVGVYFAIGVPQSTTTLQTVSQCLAQLTGGTCGPHSTPTPARLAGLRPGDRIVAFGGHRVTNWTQLERLTRSNRAKPTTITVIRHGRTLVLHVHPVIGTLPSLTNPTQTVRAGYLGVSSLVVNNRSVGTVLSTTGHDFGTTIAGSFAALGRIPSAIPQLFEQTVHGTPRSANGLVGVYGVGKVTTQALEQKGVGIGDRIGSFLFIIAGLNVFVGIFNLLPLLPLDGGHLAIVWFEAARRRLYRLRGRADPGHVDLNKLLPAAYLIVAVFIGLSVLLLLADIVNPIKNPFGG
jgi:membrane-associated protease RseP (regulator of RpoE activity)